MFVPSVTQFSADCYSAVIQALRTFSLKSVVVTTVIVGPGMPLNSHKRGSCKFKADSV